MQHSEDLDWLVAGPDLVVCLLILGAAALMSKRFSLGTLLKKADDSQQVRIERQLLDHCRNRTHWHGCFQTAQDYAIAITNPPPTCNDPREYKRHFERLGYGKVVGVTIR
jgi:hypothetical protein